MADDTIAALEARVALLEGKLASVLVFMGSKFPAWQEEVSFLFLVLCCTLCHPALMGDCRSMSAHCCCALCHPALLIGPTR